MNCVMCGKEIADTAKFCPYCGAKIEPYQKLTEEKPIENSAKNEAPEMSQRAEWNGESETSQKATEEKKTETFQKREMNGQEKVNILQIGFFILAGICGALALREFLTAVRYIDYGSAWTGIGCLLKTACFTGMLAILVILGILKEKEKVKTLFLALSGLAAFIVVCGLIQFVAAFFGSLFGFYFSIYTFFLDISTLLLTVIVMAAIVGIPYILLQVSGGTPDLSNILQMNSNDKRRSAGMNYNNQKTETNYNNQNTETNYNYQGNGNVPLKTNRGLLGYILLSIITCGIYSYYFIYTVARDVNVACAGDGKSTGGLLKFILLSIITCGIYSWWWEYSLGNRLAENAPRYGMSFSENGTTVLMWILFGWLLCGIGPFIAMNIIIKNTNSICMAYNRQNGLI